MGYGKAHQKIGKKGQARDIPEWRKAEPCKTRRRRRASAVAHRARPSTFGEKRAAAQASMPGVARAGRAGLASARPACGHSLARGSRGVASGPMGAHRGGEADPRQTSPSTYSGRPASASTRATPETDRVPTRIAKSLRAGDCPQGESKKLRTSTLYRAYWQDKITRYTRLSSWFQSC